VRDAEDLERLGGVGHGGLEEGLLDGAGLAAVVAG